MTKTLPRSLLPPSHSVGLGDLVRLFDAFGKEVGREMAEFLGFEPQGSHNPFKKEEQEQTPSPPTGGSPTPFEEEEPEPVEQVTVIDLPMWILKHRERIAEPSMIRSDAADSQKRQPQRDRAKVDGIAIQDNHPPLFPWRAVGKGLHRVLGDIQSSRAIDEARAVAAIARLEPLLKVPRRKHHDWPNDVMVILDGSSHLTPYAKDYLGLGQALVRLLGQSGQTLWWVDMAGMAIFYQGTSKGFREAPVPMPRQDMVVLALSDLGTLAPGQRLATRWHRIGRWYAKHGARTFALLPGEPRARTPRSSWTRLIGSLHTGVERYRIPSEDVVHDAKNRRREWGVEVLLTLMAATIRVELDLLRALMLLLPSDLWGLGLECLVWQHADLVGSPEIKWLDPERRPHYRKRFTDEALFRDLPEIRGQAFALIRHYHRNLDEAIGEEERVVFQSAIGDVENVDLVFFEALERRMVELADLRVARYIRRFTLRHFHDPGLWASSVIFPRLLALQRQLLDTPTDPIPPGCEPYFLDEEIAGVMPKTEWRIMYFGGSLQLVPSDLSLVSPDVVARRTLATFETARASLVCGPHWNRLESRALDGGQPSSLADGRGDRFFIRTERERMSLTRLRLPEPAVAMGEDERGVWIHLNQTHSGRDLYWLEPRRWRLSSGQSFFWRTGAWVDAAVHAILDKESFPIPRWAQRSGTDEYGLFADVMIAGVSQRFRWIGPGAFKMGSTEAEDGDDDERPRHPVWITKPFWMADTACSQRFWTAVMETEPSHFTGNDLPVDSVSWNDVRTFLDRLTETLPGAEFRLPYEAEWEYACRAGTATPFAFGHAITTEQVNFNGRAHLGGEVQGQSREGTTPVTSFPPNDWGLFQMHGNVWEWCRDWDGAYTDGLAIDPQGPDTGHERVLRGGGWIRYARLCRSAARDAGGPGVGWLDYGFRLVSGHGDSEEKAKRPGVHPSSDDGQVAGTDTGQASRKKRGAS
ncbi:Formylglycine-generating enzyme family protein [Sulfidibacter corallicola]|uniref:Formylglycine-generating enzyme family protein n=1 Tax=Sulfidibacter corallicola TaxID=2818388 RepID=A0A8A4TPT0_SULCO|nr:formylglycine-generating enzyme family protein [Sulfidibacter corallicola]QTD48575.1 formylglycine-generating enzyme family protein [Sulfidibacter corallicola]